MTPLAENIAEKVVCKHVQLDNFTPRQAIEAKIHEQLEGTVYGNISHWPVLSRRQDGNWEGSGRRLPKHQS